MLEGECAAPLHEIVRQLNLDLLLEGVNPHMVELDQSKGGEEEEEKAWSWSGQTRLGHRLCREPSIQIRSGS